MSAELEKMSTKFVGVIDEAELALRIVESSSGMKRPPGLTAVEALDHLLPENRETARKVARAVMEYWRECIENAQRPS